MASPPAGPFPHAAASWGRWMGPPRPGLWNKGAHVTRGFTSLAGKGHKMFRSQIQDSGHFSKSWEIWDFSFFFSFFRTKEREKKKRPSTVLSSPRPRSVCPPPPFICLSPGMVRRHPQLPGVASCSGYIVTCSVSPGLCPLLAGRNSPGFTFSSAKWIDGPQTSKMGPFQACFLQTWVYQGRMRGSSGVAEKPSQKQRN